MLSHNFIEKYKEKLWSFLEKELEDYDNNFNFFSKFWKGNKKIELTEEDKSLKSIYRKVGYKKT